MSRCTTSTGPGPRVTFEKDGVTPRDRLRLHRRLRRVSRRVPRQRAAQRHHGVREGLSVRLAGPAVGHAAGVARAHLRQHPRGFALCSMRSPTRSRYYLQVPLTEKVENWSDDAFWDELARRLDEPARRALVTGPRWRRASPRCAASSPSRCASGGCSWRATPATSCRPTGAKGLNLAATDVKYLATALIEHYRDHSDAGLDTYSERCLRRVWRARAVLMVVHVADAPIPRRRRSHRRQAPGRRARLSLPFGACGAHVAENYVGLPLDFGDTPPVPARPSRADGG